jgi:hypothetical protein
MHKCLEILKEAMLGAGLLPALTIQRLHPAVPKNRPRVNLGRLRAYKYPHRRLKVPTSAP